MDKPNRISISIDLDSVQLIADALTAQISTLPLRIRNATSTHELLELSKSLRAISDTLTEIYEARNADRRTRMETLRRNLASTGLTRDTIDPPF